MSAPSRKLVDELYRDKVRAARTMSAEERLRAAGELFDEVCERMRAGIRAQHPEAAEAQVEEILRKRLEITRRLEQRGDE